LTGSEPNADSFPIGDDLSEAEEEAILAKAIVPTVRLKEGRVRLIDQTRLPEEVSFVECESAAEVAECIRTLRIRGAPAIGIAAAMGMAVEASRSRARELSALASKLEGARRLLASTRPTAVDLFTQLNRMKSLYGSWRGSVAELRERLATEARRVLLDDIRLCRAIGEHGSSLLEDGDRVFTHCNAGALATGGWGTALGVIYSAKEKGVRTEVFAAETRPVLQGARLTAWELMQAGVEVTLVADGATAWTMKQHRFACVIVGADRVAANGDAANKIGTLGVALAARENGVPFYVAAPRTSFDLELATGEEIPIELRGREELLSVGGRRIAPVEAGVFNPAFDVTPREMIAGYITEKGILKPPFRELGPAGGSDPGGREN